MRPILARRLYYYLVFIALCLGSSVLLRRIELLLLPLPCLGAILLGLWLYSPSRYTLESSFFPQEVQEGDEVEVHITITAHTPLPLLALTTRLSPSVTVQAGNPCQVLSLQAGEREVITYRLCCQRRGRLLLGPLAGQASHFPGLFWQEQVHALPHPLLIYPRLSFLRRGLLPSHTQVYAGNYVSQSHGEGLEYSNTRSYIAGDNFRRINWRVSQRWSHIYVNEYARERNADVIIMIDSLLQVGDQRFNTLDLSVRGAASLAHYYLQRKDRVGLLDYGGMLRWVKPAMGAQQFYRIMDRLLDSQVTFSYVSKDITLVPKRILPPRALVIVFSPLLDQRIFHALADLAARRFDVNLIIPSPALVLNQVFPDTPTNRLASRLWRLRWKQRIAQLYRLGIGSVEWDGITPLETVLLALEGVRRQKRRMG